MDQTAQASDALQASDLPQLAHLRRPRMLIRAARLGMGDYRRERDLRRLIGSNAPPGEVLSRLISAEIRHEDHRRSGAATYSAADHVDVLIALVCEARIAQRAS
ncbi:MAG: DUF6477 family protein [Cypionkella sp.]|jgi:hypothetical protein|nr:DUF6477 family protein [Cypionkella sp.]